MQKQGVNVMCRSMKFLPVLLFAIVTLASSASAEILHYTDANGRKVYVDSPYKIPPQFRKASQQVEVVLMTQAEKLASQKSRQKLSDEYLRKQQIRELGKKLEQMTTPVRIIGNQVLVPVNVVWRGRKASLHLLLDTGASMTVLHKGSVSSLKAVSRDTSYAQVAGGGLIKTERVVFDRLELGPYRIENKSTAVIATSGSQPFDGLLGMDILGGGRYNIDFDQQQIIWAPDQYKELTAVLEALKQPEAESVAVGGDKE